MNYSWPSVGGENKITQKFGENPDGIPDYYSKNFGHLGHNGIDIWGVKGDPILAPTDGKVTYAAFDATGFGNLVIIDDADDNRHYLAHLDSISVKVGNIVKQGQKVGGMGNTGNVISGPNSDGTHLHYGIKPKNPVKNNGYGGFVDPLPFLKDVSAGTDETVEIAEKLGQVEVVTTQVRLRLAPGLDGKFHRWVYTGERFKKTGKIFRADGLDWAEVNINGYIAVAEDGVRLIKDA
ncbi:MAG: M23 family metallopeptidase [Flexilinea sp.]